MIELRRSAHRPLISVSVACAMIAGCAGTPHSSSDPNERLDAIVKAWQDQRASGIGCEDRFESRRPVVDCARIRKALDALALDFPRHSGVLFAAAIIAREDGRPEKAQSYLSALLVRQPAHPEAGILRARIAMDQGNVPLAARTLEEQILFAPDHAGLRETFASTAYLRGDWTAAKRSLREAEQLGAPDWRIAYHRGLIAEAQGLRDEAAAHYRRSIDARPDFERARSRLAGIALGPTRD